MRRGHHDAVTRVPDGIKRAIGANYAVKTFQRAVIIARQAGNAAQIDGTGPRNAIIRGAGEHEFTGCKSEVRPSDIQIAGMRAGGVCHDPGLVFKRNARS